jgi:hypothetical protein
VVVSSPAKETRVFTVDGREREYVLEQAIVADFALVRAWKGDPILSIGYAGHGVQMATYMGRQMAEYMSGVPEVNIWRDFEFRRIPGHFGPPWFLPVAGAYYNFKDRVS